MQSTQMDVKEYSFFADSRANGRRSRQRLGTHGTPQPG